MFAKLRRHNNPISAGDVPLPDPGTPDIQNAPKPNGVSMKFQYGSGESPLDGYVIKRGVGSGGFGEVYFAESDSGKEVALKRIQKNLDVEVRGVRHCLNLRHPNLVGIYDIRFDKLEQGWIVMEFIDGDSLRDRLDRSPNGISMPDAQQLFAQLVAGVAYLHDQGIVHRDLKPANVFIDGGLIKIGDYGLSKYISASRRGGQTESVGTFHYMAPEIGKGEYGKEIDIYSLGIILYEMITGNVPFDGESSQEIILKHLTADPDLTNVPQPFAYVIQRAMAKNPTSRFRDCREILTAMGWELDASGLAAKNADGKVPEVPPVLQPLYAHQPNGYPPGTPMGAQAAGPRGAGNRAAPQPFVSPNWMNWNLGNGGNNANGNSVDFPYREPLAAAVQSAFVDAQAYIKKLPPGPRGLLIAFSVLFLVMNSAIIAPLLLVFFLCYLCYYVVWYLSVGANKTRPTNHRPQQYAHQQPRPAPNASRSGQALQATAHYPNAPPQLPPTPPASKPVSVSSKVVYRNWLTEQRKQLGQLGFWNRSHTLMRGLTFSGLVAAVLTFGGGMLTMSRNEIHSQDIVGGIVWLGVMTLASSWVVLFLTRRWESQAEDSIVFRFVQLTVGIGLGILSYNLSTYLLIPWNEIQAGQQIEFRLGSGPINKSWRGFYGEDFSPLLAGHVAYFGLLMWLVRWWRQSDSLRRSRFGVWPIAWSVAMAGLAQGLVYFPGPWCLIYAGATSFVVQMASPWTNYDETSVTASQSTKSIA